MTSQPKAKGEMYILNDGMNMKAEIAAMERRLEELEMNQMQEVQAISQTPLQVMPCAICRSYEHLVEECPTIPAEREMFGDCNTYNSNWRDHPNFSWKPQPPQYQQPAQAPQQASNLEQAMVNLCKVVGDFIEKQEATNARFDQRIDRVESTLNKRMDEMQNDLSQNIHEMEVEEGEPSQKKEIEEVITLRSGKEVDLPTCKLEHKVESETEKENREEIKGKKKGIGIEKDDYDFDIDEEPQRIVIKEEMMKHMPPHFLQALGIVKKLKEVFRSKIGVKRSENRGKTRVCEIGTLLRNHFATQLTPLRKVSQLRNQVWHTSATSQHSGPHFAAAKAVANHQSMKSSISQGKLHLEEDFAAAKPFLAHECYFAAQEHPFRSCETHCEVVKPDFAPKVSFRRVFRNCKAGFGTRVPFCSTVTLISQLRNGCEIPKLTSPQLQTVLDLDLKRKSYDRLKMTVQTMNGNVAPPFRYCWHIFEALSGAQIMHTISRFKAWEVRSPEIQTPRRHLEGCFAAAKPLLAHECHFAAQFPSFRSCDTVAKSPLSCEITFEHRNGCEITSKLRNDLQIAKLTCEMEEGLQKHLAKPREVAKMPIEPCKYAYEEESLAHLGSHTLSLSFHY
ncbi:hypothetical protein CK203_098569 [Vitis vinifera]|uniref:Uncharacterized protein n=1 Tax=Vitis vinifera TaxID=29760 RepID=A0A438BMG9_VITVI|nr:hypothetical protein CK203_098569 [Vitis vinifera]